MVNLVIPSKESAIKLMGLHQDNNVPSRLAFCSLLTSYFVEDYNEGMFNSVKP